MSHFLQRGHQVFPLKWGYAKSQACGELCLQGTSVHLGPGVDPELESWLWLGPRGSQGSWTLSLLLAQLDSFLLAKSWQKQGQQDELQGAAELPEGAQHPGGWQLCPKDLQGEAGCEGWVCLAVCPWLQPETCSEPCPPDVLALQECDHSQTNSLEDEEIETFYKILTQRKEIDLTFKEAAGSGETLSVDQLVVFLQHQQREEAAGPALALSLIERYEPSEMGEGLWPVVPGPHRVGRSLGRRQPKSRELEGRGRLSQPGPEPLVSISLPQESR